MLVNNNYVCFDDVYDELLEPKSCYVCFDDIDEENKTMKICSNYKCMGKICKHCVKKQYFIADEHKGKIERFKVTCGFCNELIDPTAIGFSPFVRSLFSIANYKVDEKIVTSSAAQMLADGYCMWSCDSVICRDLEKVNLRGIFCAPKLACNIGMNEQDEKKEVIEMKICPKCDDYDRINNIDIWKSFGFTIFDNEMHRECPGKNCNKSYTRTNNSCPNMQCSNPKCKTYFCFCCGEKFNSANDVYVHLNKAYEKNYPSNEEIKNYLIKRQQIKEWKKNLPEDITDEEIEAMIG